MISTGENKSTVLDVNGTEDQMNFKNLHVKNEAEPSNELYGPEKIKHDVKAFYNKHFPTDRTTYEWRLPFMGLIVSFISCFSLFVIFGDYRIAAQLKPILYCYVFVAAVLAYQLYYGLHIGDRKQFTPWIILKLIEIIISLIIGIMYLVSYGIYAPWAFYVFIIYNGINCILIHIVITRSKKLLHGDQRKINPDENIYDIYNPV